MPPSSQNTHNAPSKPIVSEQRNCAMEKGDEPEKQWNALHTTQDKDVFTVQWRNEIR